MNIVLIRAPSTPLLDDDLPVYLPSVHVNHGFHLSGTLAAPQLYVYEHQRPTVRLNSSSLIGVYFYLENQTSDGFMIAYWVVERYYECHIDNYSSHCATSPSVRELCFIENSSDNFTPGSSQKIDIILRARFYSDWLVPA